MSDVLETIKVVTDLAKKSMNVELQEKIMELRIEVVSLKEENVQQREKNNELREENITLKQEIEKYTKGNICPKCHKSTLNLEKEEEHPQFGSLGTRQRIYKCPECGFTTTRKYTGKDKR